MQSKLLMQNPFRLTASAFQAIQNFLERHEEKLYVRISNPSKGCVVGSFQIALDSLKLEHDQEYTIDDISFLLNTRDVMKVVGLEIDYEKDENGDFGFVFRN